MADRGAFDVAEHNIGMPLVIESLPKSASVSAASLESHHEHIFFINPPNEDAHAGQPESSNEAEFNHLTDRLSLSRSNSMPSITCFPQIDSAFSLDSATVRLRKGLKILSTDVHIAQKDPFFKVRRGASSSRIGFGSIFDEPDFACYI